MVYFYWDLFYRPADILECSVVYQSTVAGLNRKPTGWEWEHDLTVMLAIDLATLCGIFSTIGPQLDPPYISDKF